MANNTGCCGSPKDPAQQVRDLYTALALHPQRDFGWDTGKHNARRLGYDTAWLEQLAESIWESAAAVGNPFSLGPIRAGETVLDLGCGAGADVCIAALLVGASGRVVGVDVTPAMVEKARRNARLAGLENVEVHETDAARLPLPDACIDVVISNGAINLAPDKGGVFREAYRVLRPGGRLQFADMVHSGSACTTTRVSAEASWADCVAGTLPAEEVVSLLTKAGFRDAALAGFSDYKTSSSTIGAMFRALK